MEIAWLTLPPILIQSWGIGNHADKGYTMKFGMKDKLVGVERTVKAEINNPKTKSSWKGEIKFKYAGVTLEEVMTFADKDRTIAFASTARKELGTLKGVKVVEVIVKSPGTRTGVSEPMTQEGVEKYLASLDPKQRDAIMDRVRPKA